ncbi:MAG: hypothetical protein PHZ09_07120 [Eubacteriales bacterium]|jgi:hypothetical protein|nr:hypothetical protein [Eubacteriales bacterium]
MQKTKQTGMLPTLTGLCALNTLLAGVIPSIKFDSLDVSIGFFDLIQYLPVLQAIYAVACMSCVIMTAVFSYISFIPRQVPFVCASAAFVTALAAVITLDAGIIYLKKGFGSVPPAGGGLNYGLEYNFIIVLFLLLNAACVLLSGLCWLRCAAPEDKKTAVLRRPRTTGHTKTGDFRPPDDLG